MFILVCCVTYLHFPLSGPDLTYISLPIISCIIEYVTYKKTLNLEMVVRENPSRSAVFFKYSDQNVWHQ